MLTKIGATILIIFGLVMIMGVIVGIAEGNSKYSLVTDLSLGTLAGILPIALGVRLLWRQATQQNELQRQADNKMVFLVAARLGGKLTALEVAQQTNIPLTKVQKILDSLQRDGLADLRVSSSGAIIYEIKGLNLSESEKNESERL
jgi:hypothetical protein